MRRDDPEAAELPAPQALPAPPAQVIEALAPLLSAERLERIEAVVQHRLRSVVAVLEAVDDPRNVAAVLRTADALGLQEVHLIERGQPFLASRRVTQGAERWLDLIQHRSAAVCVGSLRSRGFQVYVATMHGERTPEQLRPIGKLALVFGNEHEGTSRALLEACDGSCSIPMRGFSQSLNVSVAAALALRAVTCDRKGDLTPQGRAELRARFMLLSVERGDQVVAEHLARHGR